MNNDLRQKPIYIAPANPAGKALANELSLAGYQVVGLADNLKQGDGIINSSSQAVKDAVIIIANGEFRHVVAAGLKLRGFTSSQIWQADADRKIITYRQPTPVFLRQKFIASVQTLFCWLRHLTPKKHYLYYAEDFFDSNVLLAYREHRRQYPKEAWLVGRKLNITIPELAADDHVLIEKPLRSLLRYLTARKVVVDHQYMGNTFSTLRKTIPVIQLWHGLPYKALTGNIHYPDICDEAFVSSSIWFNEHIFPKIFRAKHYLALGYPRNDAFLQTAEERDWINAESLNTLQQVQQKTGEIVVYAPTYRDWDDNDYPLDLTELNNWCVKHNISFILKFHPFISRKFSDAMGLGNNDVIQSLPGLPHIYLYPSGKNIYPWLAEANLLITDYSSIIYDFLMVNRPIIYFQYDIEKYKAIRGETMVGDEDFIAGKVTSDQLELQQEMTRQITQSNVFETDRQRLLDKFGRVTALSARQVVELASK